MSLKMCFLYQTLFIIALCALETLTLFTEPSRYYSMDQDLSTDATKDDCGKPLILTPYIKGGKIKEAQKLARVNLKDVSDLESYSGFLTVNESCNSNMFFWYFTTERKQASDPLVIWLQGGPGGSSLFGLAEEIGPFYIKNGSKLEKRQYHWSDKRNLLFIDNPVGTGFSFTRNVPECYSHNEDEVRANLYNALLQFYELFPNLQKNDLFIFGESYAGKYIPALAYSIYENNDKAKIKINLKGLGIGDGYTDPVNMLDYGSLLYNAGLINKNGRDVLNIIADKSRKYIQEKDWQKAFTMFLSMQNNIKKLIGSVNIYNYLETDHSTADNMNYFNRKDVKCRLHAGNISFGELSQIVYHYLTEDMPQSVKPWVEKLLENYRIMFYNGQVDIIVGPVLTQNFIKTLKWSGADKFQKERQFGVKDGNLIAFGTEYGNLREYRIRIAGHMAPRDQPKAMYYIMDNFINNKTLKNRFH